MTVRSFSTQYKTEQWSKQWIIASLFCFVLCTSVWCHSSLHHQKIIIISQYSDHCEKRATPEPDTVMVMSHGQMLT